MAVALFSVVLTLCVAGEKRAPDTPLLTLPGFVFPPFVLFRKLTLGLPLLALHEFYILVRSFQRHYFIFKQEFPLRNACVLR